MNTLRKMFLNIIFIVLMVHSLSASKISVINKEDHQNRKFALDIVTIICKLNAKTMSIYYEENASIEFVTTILMNINTQCYPPKLRIIRSIYLP